MVVLLPLAMTCSPADKPRAFSFSRWSGNPRRPPGRAVRWIATRIATDREHGAVIPRSLQARSRSAHDPVDSRWSSVIATSSLWPSADLF